jgi:hypothetical protein
VVISVITTPTVRPELVEGLSFFLTEEGREGQGFDKLSPNGIYFSDRYENV